MRKYLSEFGLNMKCTLGAQLQQEHLERLDQDITESAPDFHIYMIARRPRITLDPSSFCPTTESISGVLRTQRNDRQEEHEFTVPNRLGTANLRLECNYPYTEFKIYDDQQNVQSEGKVALLVTRFGRQFWNLLDLEVLYIGQAFGDDGKRVAPDRLKSHSTLQRIYAESIRLSPDQEVWIALFQFDPVLMMSFDGRSQQFLTSDEEDDEHISQIAKNRISEQQSINFTEAALIRYFQPEYNRIFKNTFPNPAHSTYAECYKVDLNLVAVEIDCTCIRSRLWSPTVAPSWVHVCDFPLHSREERVHMFDF